MRRIGVFDSGVGGLTVLRALIAELPHEDFLYLGDTARLPYGTKSPDTVARYSVRAAEALVERGIKALVVACNTASATALPALRERFPTLPVIGVIEPGARAACEASASGRIAVLATEGTVQGGAYQTRHPRVASRRACHADRLPDLRRAGGRGLERGRGGRCRRRALPRASRRARRHRGAGLHAFSAAGRRDRPAARAHAPRRGFGGDDGARHSSATLAARQLAPQHARRHVRLLATDSPERFARVGARFLGSSIAERSASKQSTFRHFP